MKRLLALAFVAVLVLPATALGAVRYASPTGAGTGSCAEATPCSLAYAITAASSGDEVVVTPGTYPVAARIEATVPLSIHGVAGQPRPRLVGAKEVTVLKSGQPLTLANLAIESKEAEGGAIYAFANGDVLDHLEVIARGRDSSAFQSGANWTVTNSLLVAAGESSGGISFQGAAAGTGVLRNDTVVAEGANAMAISISGLIPITDKIEAINVIAIAEIAAVAKNNGGSMTSISFDHSDVQGATEGTVTSSAAQTAPPQFVDAASGNYREAAGSPTIGTGLYDPANGATDLDGNPRAVFVPTCSGPLALTDIGAFQYPITRPAPVCLTSVPVLPPDTKILKAKVAGRKAKFRFAATGTPATRFECKLDAKPWRSCTSPKTYKHLKPGRHVFRVRAVDAGGPDATPAKRRFRIDRPRHHPHHHRAS